MNKNNPKILSTVLGIIAALLCFVVLVRLITWNIHADEKKTFVTECQNYGTKAFCECFINDLNKHIPREAIVRMGEMKNNLTPVAKELEQASVKTCMGG